MKINHPRSRLAAAIIGGQVNTWGGRFLGEVKDLMLELSSGRIVYAVLSVKGCLGQPERLYALPWRALSYIPAEQSFRLNVAREHLQKAPGFYLSNWPVTPERGFIYALYRHYGYAPTFERNRAADEGGHGIVAGRSGQAPRPNMPGWWRPLWPRRARKQGAAARTFTNGHTTFSLPASYLAGDDIVDLRGHGVGSISDLIIELDSGQLSHVLLEHDALGRGGRRVIHWTSLYADLERGQLVLIEESEGDPAWQPLAILPLHLQVN